MFELEQSSEFTQQRVINTRLIPAGTMHAGDGQNSSYISTAAKIIARELHLQVERGMLFTKFNISLPSLLLAFFFYYYYYL